ncbi:hypothetical protein KVV02_006569 [Mortierella alpina]|uniref:F-box domain-containing protein n=1 Tax=Mortierella alpina TaxID=64518 RepID=A0A9P8CXG3_MORAP|nr:hypothetical protein KVV02_006569 [Mortierella alpina]
MEATDKDEEDAERRLLSSASKRVCTQIERLEKLETLTLDIVASEHTNAMDGDYAWDLTLSRGWLGELAGLKNLEILSLEADLWSKMGQAKVEFIYEHWPLLKDISLRGNHLELGAPSPWLWLRPRLHLVLRSLNRDLTWDSNSPVRYAALKMLNSAAHGVFGILELVLLVSEHLDPLDLAQCIQVCKAWSRQFEPVLWTNVCLKEHHVELLGNTRPSPLKIALLRNLPRIRTIRTSDANVALVQVLINRSSTDPSTLCTNLKRLEIEDISVAHRIAPWPLLEALLDLNPRLTHLKLPFQAVITYGVLPAVSKLDHLQQLSVYSTQQCTRLREMLMFLQACLPLPNLTELLMDLDLACVNNGDVTDTDLRIMVQEAERARFSRDPTATKIKSLRLPSCRNLMWNPLPLILLKSKLLDLESCEIPWFDADEVLEEVEDVVRRHCPNLKYLYCPSFGNEEEEDGEIVWTFVLACSGIRSFVSHRFSDQGPRSRPRDIISTLVSKHFSTLEDFELTECVQVNSYDQQTILSQCRRLKQFWVLSSYSTGNYIGIDPTDILEKNWVCVELTKLGLTLNRFSRCSSAFAGNKEDSAHQLLAIAAKNVYTQIGRLTKLEILVLDIEKSVKTKARKGDYAWDLTLSRGWLGELAGLKSLKTLRLQADLWSGMGQAEMEFIHEQWPLLREVGLRGKSLQMSAQSTWFWLLNKRPQLRLVHE